MNQIWRFAVFTTFAHDYHKHSPPGNPPAKLRVLIFIAAKITTTGQHTTPQLQQILSDGGWGRWR